MVICYMCEVGHVYCLCCHFVFEPVARGERCESSSLHSNEVAVAIFDVSIAVCCFHDAQCNASLFLVECNVLARVSCAAPCDCVTPVLMWLPLVLGYCSVMRPLSLY